MINFRCISRVFSKGIYDIDTFCLEGFKKRDCVEEALQFHCDVIDSDEIVLVDAVASRFGTQPNYLKFDLGCVKKPLTVGGGITDLATATKALELGAERLILNSINFTDLGLMRSIASDFGEQAVVGMIDVVWYQHRYWCVSHGGCDRRSIAVPEAVALMRDNGMGELYVHSIDKDGLLTGPDTDLFSITSSLDVPFIFGGGLANIADVEHLAKSSKSCHGVVSRSGVLANPDLFKQAKHEIDLPYGFWR